MWLKLHLTCGTKTNIVTAVQVSDGYANDYHYFKGLVNRTAEIGFNMKDVSADDPILERRIFEHAVAWRIPYIPFNAAVQRH